MKPVNVMNMHRIRHFTGRINSHIPNFWCLGVINPQIWPNQCEIWHGAGDLCPRSDCVIPDTLIVFVSLPCTILNDNTSIGATGDE